MEQHCLRHTEIPGASRLFGDLIYHFDRVSSFYPHDPYDPASFVAAAEQIDFSPERRAAIVAALRISNPDCAALDRLAEPGTVAVVTGQQVGLFGGPLYTVFKALAAIRLAQQLTERGLKAVPVFWFATEDHDLAEINQSWFFGEDQRPVSLRTAAANPLAGPVGPIVLRETPLAGMRASLVGLPFADEAASMVEACYQDGVTFGSAFRALVETLLKPYGMIYMDPLEPAIRQLAAPFLAGALGRSRELVQSVQQRSKALEAAGYHAQVHVEDNASLFFAMENGRRIPLKRTEKGFNDFALGALQERAETLSPNALLRPVMQDFLLPTVAYLGGPAELAYFAQSAPLYEALLGRMPVMLHRASFTLLDRRGAKLMKKYGLSLPDVAVPDVTLREKIAARLVPAGVDAQFAASRAVVEAELGKVAAAMRGFDPGLEKALTTSSAKVLYQIDKMQRKTAREALRRDTRAGADAQFLHDLLYPHRHLQERLYSVVPFLARHGMDLVERIFDCVKPECPDHQILSVD